MGMAILEEGSAIRSDALWPSVLQEALFFGEQKQQATAISSKRQRKPYAYFSRFRVLFLFSPFVALVIVDARASEKASVGFRFARLLWA